MGGFLRRLLAWKNIVALLTIVMAFLGAFGVLEKNFNIDTTQVILATLAFLAIESLIERLEVLGNIEDGMRSLKEFISPRSLSEIFFQTRRELPVERVLDDAKREIWVSGISLATMVMQIATLKSRLQQGCKLRFLAVAPAGIALREGYKSCSAGTAQMERATPQTIGNNLKTLWDSLSPFATEEGQLEIRVVDRIPLFGFLITDPEYATSQMRVQVYPHQVEIDEAPLFVLRRESDQRWYDFFNKQFEKLWKESQAYSPGPKILGRRFIQREIAGDELLIHYATYGAGDAVKDVTELLRSRTVENTLEIYATNDELGCDPAPGVVKTLKVIYSFAGEKNTREIPEKALLSLP